MSQDYKEKPMEGHSYDGIQEYDNPLPPWWTNLFWATIIFSIGYCAYYMTGVGPTVVQEYKADVAANEPKVAVAQASTEDIGPKLVKAALDPARVAAGKAIFAAKCLACHGPEGAGLIGPNLTDTNWIHGSKMADFYKVINEGVLDKGMIAWKGQLTDDEIVSAVAFIRSIQNTNIAGKPAQGEPGEPTPLS